MNKYIGFENLAKDTIAVIVLAFSIVTGNDVRREVCFDFEEVEPYNNINIPLGYEFLALGSLLHPVDMMIQFTMGPRCETHYRLLCAGRSQWDRKSTEPAFRDAIPSLFACIPYFHSNTNISQADSVMVFNENADQPSE